MSLTLLYIVFVLTAIVLITVILLQEGKGGGFGDALGAAGQQAFGVKASGVQRFTMYVAIAFLASAVLIHVLNKKSQDSVTIEDGMAPAPISAPMSPGIDLEDLKAR